MTPPAKAAPRKQEVEPRVVSKDEAQPLTVSKGDTEVPQVPKLHVWLHASGRGWNWRFSSPVDGSTLAQSDLDDAYSTRHEAIKAADAWADGPNGLSQYLGGSHVHIAAEGSDAED
jgi:hypothetical protein